MLLGKISVVLAVKDGMPFLKESISSILNQTEEGFELLVVENGSSDGTLEYLNTLKDGRIKLFAIGNCGLISAYNFGFSNCIGDYIAVADADDIYHRDRLKMQKEVMMFDRDIGLVGTSIYYFAGNLSRIWRVRMPTSHEKISKSLRSGKFALVNSTIMFRKDIFSKIGGYRDNIFPVPDLDFFLRAGQISKMQNIEGISSGIRLHENSFTYIHMSDIIKKQDELLSLENSAVRSLDEGKNNLFRTKFIHNLKLKSWKYYRLGVMKYLQGSKVFWVLFFIFAGVLNPSKAYFFIKEKLTFSK